MENKLKIIFPHWKYEHFLKNQHKNNFRMVQTYCEILYIYWTCFDNIKNGHAYMYIYLTKYLNRYLNMKLNNNRYLNDWNVGMLTIAVKNIYSILS